MTKTPARVLFRALCLIGALACTAACMSTPQGPVTAKRMQPKIFTKGWDCDREPIAGQRPDECVWKTHYVPRRCWLTVNKIHEAEVRHRQYRRCQVNDQYPDCARN